VNSKFKKPNIKELLEKTDSQESLELEALEENKESILDGLILNYIQFSTLKAD